MSTHPKEARKLLEVVRGHRLEALFTAAISLGLRMGECLGLQWADIDFGCRLFRVGHNLQRVKRVRRGDVVREGEAKTERLLGQSKGKKIHSLQRGVDPDRTERPSQGHLRAAPTLLDSAHHGYVRPPDRASAAEDGGQDGRGFGYGTICGPWSGLQVSSKPSLPLSW